MGTFCLDFLQRMSLAPALLDLESRVAYLQVISCLNAIDRQIFSHQANNRAGYGKCQSMTEVTNGVLGIGISSNSSAVVYYTWLQVLFSLPVLDSVQLCI